MKGEDAKTRKKRRKKKCKRIYKEIIRVATLIALVVTSTADHGVSRETKRANEHEFEKDEQEQELSLFVEQGSLFPLGDAICQGYWLHNAKGNITGGTMEMYVVVIVTCGEKIIKEILVSGALHDIGNAGFEVREQEAAFYLKEPGKLEQKKEALKHELLKYLSTNGDGMDYSFSVKTGVVFYFQFSDQNNEPKNLSYMVCLEDMACYKNNGKYDRCDSYIMSYDVEDEGDEYRHMIYQAGDRIMDCG